MRRTRWPTRSPPRWSRRRRQPAGPGRAGPDADAAPVPRRRPAAGVTAGRECAAPGVPGHAGRALPVDTRWLVLLAAAEPVLAEDELVRAATESGTDIAALEPAERAGLVKVDAAGELSRAAAARRRVRGGERGPSAGRARACWPGCSSTAAAAGLHAAATLTRPDAVLADALERAAAEGRPGDRIPGPGAGGRDLRRPGGGGQPARRGGPARLGRRRAAPGPDAAAPAARRGARARPVRAQVQLLLGEIELRAGASSHAAPALLAAAGDLDHDRELRVRAMMQAGEAMCLSGEYGALRRRGAARAGVAPVDEPLGHPADVRPIGRADRDVPRRLRAGCARRCGGCWPCASQLDEPARADPGQHGGDRARRRPAGLPARRTGGRVGAEHRRPGGGAAGAGARRRGRVRARPLRRGAATRSNGRCRWPARPASTGSAAPCWVCRPCWPRRSATATGAWPTWPRPANTPATTA